MITVICGKSGSGKTTLRELLLKSDKSFKKVMSNTTRPMRLNEKNGADYFFIDEETYHNENFVITRKSGDYLYGITKENLNISNPILIIDMDGIKQLKEYTDFKVIFIDASDAVLISRLKNRGDSESEIISRLKSEKDFTLENVQKIIKPCNILYINNETIHEAFKKSKDFINKSRKNFILLKDFQRIRE